MNEQQLTGKTTASLTQRLDVNFALRAAGLGIWEVDPVTNQVIWDERCRTFFGLKSDTILTYEQALEYIHPDDMVRVDRAVKWAMNAESDGQYDQTYRTIGDEQIRWVHFIGKADRTQDGTVSRFAGVAQDITRQVVSQQKLTASEARFQMLIEEAPVATSLFVGRQLRVEVANEPMLAIWGKGPNQIGRNLADILPEIANQPFLAILDNVFTSGQTFSAKGGRADLVIDGVPGTYYFDFTYKPLFDTTGTVYAILQMAVDVTQQVIAQQQKEEAILALQNAIELAELGTFSIDLTTNLLTVSPRVADWLGFNALTTDTEAFINGVGEADRPLVRSALDRALLPGSDGRYDVVHSVVNPETGHRRFLHALGRLYIDAAGKPFKLEGTAQDITAERAMKQVLEQQVQQRTEELATNLKELEEANSLLTRSNENLQTFAYVASHDLQEPLRKIQQFGDLLQSQYSGVLGEGVGYLQRMQTAASRMSTLIKDLLGFSRISTQRSIDEPVALNDVVSSVLSVLDLTIAESNARVQVGKLPVVPGDAAQLGQLFQNLISNALKFQRSGSSPQIRIDSQAVDHSDLPPSIKPARRTPIYHRVTVTDNGIGFDEKYLDRIFQVFQRLHGRDQYTGTGVGLAICEKVVANHGGVITATSQPGQGATFTIYLPAD